MKRGRNHQRRRQGSNPNRALDSNGPEVRIRGTANQIYDKYMNLARDASSSGDRIKAESYFQHAEHYFRLIRLQQPAQPQHQPNPPQHAQGESAADQPSIDGGEEKKDQAPPQARQNNGAGSSADQDKEPEPTPTPATTDSASDVAEVKKPRRRRTPRKPVKDAGEESSGEAAAEDAPTAVE